MSQSQIDIFDEIIVDNFAGGGVQLDTMAQFHDVVAV